METGPEGGHIHEERVLLFLKEKKKEKKKRQTPTPIEFAICPACFQMQEKVKSSMVPHAGKSKKYLVNRVKTIHLIVRQSEVISPKILNINLTHHERFLTFIVLEISQITGYLFVCCICLLQMQVSNPESCVC